MNICSHVIKLSPSDDCGASFTEALNLLGKEKGPKCLVLSPGKYIFRKKDAHVQTLPVSNTVRKEECQIKHIGLHLNDLEDLTIEGNDAELIFDGDMSAIVLSCCSKITIQDLSIDYIHPRVSEMTVLHTEGNTAEFAIHSSSCWTGDEQGRFCFLNGDGIREDFDSFQVVQVASPDRRSNLRSKFNPVRSSCSFEEISPGKVRFYYNEPPCVKEGEVWQFRDPSRRENGIAITDSENIVLQGLKLYFTPGLGVVAQMSRNLMIRDHYHAPAPGSQRVCAAFADCIQISSCYGKVEIADSFFSGAQDDPINVHGTYLGVVRIRKELVTVRFCHGETWGFLPYKEGDEICFVRKTDLQRLFSCYVRKAELLDSTTVLLTLDRPADGIDAQEGFVLENMSSYPDVSIHDCIFECYPTRGILLSSAGICRVYNNEIRQTSPSPGILIAGDAEDWYESGGVRDVLIRNNLFRYCPGYAVRIDPSITPDSGTVHRNIILSGNKFEDCSLLLLYYHSAEGLSTDLPQQHIVHPGRGENNGI